MFKKTLAILMAAMTIFASGCGEGSDKNKEPETSYTTTEGKVEEPVKTEDKVSEPTKTEENTDLYENKVFFTIKMADGGVMKGEIYPDLAPITVENFITLCDKEFYNGLVFHRVIEGFMIQGGGFTPDMEQVEAPSIKGEFKSNGVENNLKHERGVLSMARTNVMDSASSQFFIMHDVAPHLDGEYAAFGRITEGFDVLDKIAKTETGVYQNIMPDVPVTPQVIETITIER